MSKRIATWTLISLALTPACLAQLPPQDAKTGRQGEPGLVAANRNDADLTSSKPWTRPVVPPLPPQPGRASSISLSPAVVMTRGSFGQSTTQTLTLTNSTPNEMSFELVAEDVLVENGKRVFVPAGQTPGSIAATAVFSSKIILLKPQMSGSVDVHFTVPPASPVRAVVALFRGINKVASAQNGVAMTASLGTLITFTLSDNFKVSAEPIQLADGSDGATLTVVQPLTNVGSEPIVPEGMLAILDESGALVMKAPIPAQRLLPGEHLQFQAQCAAMLGPGKYRVLASYKFEGQTTTEAGELTLR